MNALVSKVVFTISARSAAHDVLKMLSSRIDKIHMSIGKQACLER